MAYIALYRAYRPQKFVDVVGQEHIKKTLQNAITTNKVAHAYLFCGPRGTGKTTLAKIMAKAMNCEHGPSIEPCCECEICQGITKGMISDVIEIDAASNNGADDIRALRETVKFLPSQGKYKVYIIDEVHMLSTAAFNALLKTLEEPPHHVIFILATTEPYKLPNTILSRCQRFDFQSISLQDILKRLRIVADEEKINITDEALYQIAISAEGGMRDALSLFDQTISYSVNPQITLDDVLAVSGNISYVKIINLLNACISDDNTNSIVLLDSLLKEGKEAPRIVNDIILFLRDTLLYKNNTVLDKKLMFENQEFILLSKKLSSALIYSWIDVLNNTLVQMKSSTQKRAYIELAILKMSDKSLIKEANLLDRIESLENTVKLLSQNGFNQPMNNYNNNYQPKSYTNPNYGGYQQPIEVPAIPSVEELQQMASDEYKAPSFEEIPSSMFDEPTNVVQTPVVENIVPVQEPVKTETKAPEVANDLITVRDVERILYKATKQAKENLIEVLKKINEKYSITQMPVVVLSYGKIVAASDDEFIVELSNVSFCNRLMQYANYVKLIEIFKEFGLNIKDYVCVPAPVWNTIKAEYAIKHKDNPTPKLDDTFIGVKKRVIPSVTVNKEDSFVDSVKDLIDDDILKIMEE